MREHQFGARIAHLPLANVTTLLLKLGNNDESLYYQAGMGEIVGENSFHIHLHDNALILERLRLHGALDVMVQLAHGSVYRAELLLLRRHDKNETVRITLGEICDEVLSAPKFLPLT